MDHFKNVFSLEGRTALIVGGGGLGLPIAASIATEHKGTLKAESDQASTRFLFSMPLKK